MKAFISYAHIDERYVNRLHIHLAQIKREGLMDVWYDREISAGSVLTEEIAKHLSSSDVFIAITSPDFLASHYCQDIEMKRAIELHDTGKIRVIPMIVEPCDWLSSPLSQFVAVPRDGKAISEWENANNAYLEIVGEIRKITAASQIKTRAGAARPKPKIAPSKRYRTKVSFDKIDKIKYKKEAFNELAKKLESWCDEANTVDGIKAHFERADDNRFYVTLVNRNKSNLSSERTVYMSNDRHGLADISTLNGRSTSSSSSNGGFSVKADDYNLHLTPAFFSFGGHVGDGLMTPSDAAHHLWNMMMREVGIEYASD